MYAIYSNNLERFLLVDDDLWVLRHTAILISSKLTTSICEINNIEINKSNCTEWTLSIPSMSKQDQQIPKLSIIGNAIEKSIALSTEENEKLKEDCIFCLYVLNVVKSSWYVNALYNSSNQKYFLDLLKIKSLSYVHDETGIEGGFIPSIDEILYSSSSKEVAELKINAMFDNKFSSSPTLLLKYAKSFRKYYDEFANPVL
jgi:hypothetical protein